MHTSLRDVPRQLSAKTRMDVRLDRLPRFTAHVLRCSGR